MDDLFVCIVGHDCPHRDPDTGACHVLLDIGKTPNEYGRCEQYEPDETPVPLTAIPQFLR